MPLTVRTNAAADFSAAVLPARTVLSDVIASLPGLVGAWDADDYTTGAWAARIVTGRIALAGTTIPSKTTRAGRSVISFVANSKAFVNDAADAGVFVTALTYGVRAYFTNTTTNFQKLFDLGTPEFYFRSTLATPTWQWAGNGPSGNVNIAAPVVGWHRALFTKEGSAAAMLSAEGGAAAAFGGAGTALTSAAVVLGDAANATTAVHEISRLLICSSGALTSEQRAAVNLWLAL